MAGLRTPALAAALLIALACSRPPDERAALEASVFRAPDPSATERYCAWFGDVQDGLLVFGEAPFWSALHAGAGDPEADRRQRGPLQIGRFDVARERFLPSLALGDAESGTWDVLVHPNGRIYFTTFFEAAGSVDPVTGEVRRYPALGTGLNELALGPDGTILASRYTAPGAVVIFDAAGRLVAEHRLDAPPGHHAVAKSVAFDPARREIWVNTDLLPDGAGTVGHDARVLDLGGRELLRISDPEIQFMVFGADGRGALAEVSGHTLALRLLSPTAPGAPRDPGLAVELDDAFAPGLDFVQDLKPTPAGGLVVTRWSGRMHVVQRDGRAAALVLPPVERGALYYTGILSNGKLCATACAGIAVTCRPFAPALDELR